MLFIHRPPVLLGEVTRGSTVMVNTIYLGCPTVPQGMWDGQTGGVGEDFTAKGTLKQRLK